MLCADRGCDVFQATQCIQSAYKRWICYVLCAFFCADVDVVCISGNRVPKRDGSAMSSMHLCVLMWMWCAFQATGCLKEMDLPSPVCILCADVDVMCVSGDTVLKRHGSTMSRVHFV